MSKPLFNLGDTVVVKVNGKMIHSTIYYYPNGTIILHNDDLTEALGYCYRLNYEEDIEDRQEDNYYTDNGENYSVLYRDGFYYIVLLPTGEFIQVSENKLLKDRSDDIISRRVSNIHKKKGMNEFRFRQVDKARKNMTYLPSDINDHISSYLTQTPLSSRVNTRINNRINPGTPSSAIPITYEQRVADMQAKWDNETISDYGNNDTSLNYGNDESWSDDENDESWSDNGNNETDSTNGGTGKLRKTSKRRKVRKLRKIGKKRKTIKRKIFSQK